MKERQMSCNLDRCWLVGIESCKLGILKRILGM